MPKKKTKIKEISKGIEMGRNVKGEEDVSMSLDKELQIFNVTPKQTIMMKKTNQSVTTDQDTEEVNIKRNVKLPPIPKAAPKQAFTPVTTIKQQSKVGCFGFMSNWITKRKEKRRQKKRQAIKARDSNSMVTKLQRCEKGGVAFVVEFENTVMKKPVLPPIKSKSEPVTSDPTVKMHKAAKNRQVQIQKKVRFAHEQGEKRIENAGRKSRLAEMNGAEVDLPNMSPRPAGDPVLPRDHPDYDDDADIISPFLGNVP